jgi:hypothetical protein
VGFVAFTPKKASFACPFLLTEPAKIGVSLLPPLLSLSEDILSNFSKNVLTHAAGRVFSNYPQNLWITLWKATGKICKKCAAIGSRKAARNFGNRKNRLKS